jgi:nicotinamide mononucleotide (NMN) deamidase PncC
MSSLNHAALHEAALKLDAKMLALAESSTGGKA